MDKKSLSLMQMFVDKFLPGKSGLSVLDIGSRRITEESQPKETYRDIFEPRFEYTGMDIVNGDNVDIVGYENINGKYDIVICGQVMEHVNRPWELVKKIASYSKKYVCIIAPWRFKEHKYPIDAYRFLPDGMRDLFNFAGIRELHIEKNSIHTIGIGEVTMKESIFKKIKVSVVIPVYNSRRAFRRQLVYLNRLNLPDSIEFIIIDDGSDPPLKEKYDGKLRNCYIYPTGDKRPWTQPCARNLGVKIAQGEYILMTDIDHIITPNAFRASLVFNGDKIQFERSYGILNNHGMIVRDPKVLFDYGLTERKYRRRGLKVYHHTNTYLMRKSIFEAIGGYPEHICGHLGYPTADDRSLYGRYRRYCKTGYCSPAVKGPEVYVFPASSKDPKNLFHKLERVSAKNKVS